MSEVSEKDTVDSSDVHVLDSKEMTLASNFRSITDSFRRQAYRFAQLQKRINTEQHKYRRLLRNLKNDKSILVTRPDNGRGVVLLDKIDYLSKIHNILNDTTKFSFLSYDLTITRETKLIKLLNRLLDEGSISKDFYILAKPFGSIPSRLYGLPKVHKEDVPLRPVVSAIKTFNYGLGKALSRLLSQFIEKTNMVRDSFSFVDELLALPKYAEEKEDKDSKSKSEAEKKDNQKEKNEDLEPQVLPFLDVLVRRQPGAGFETRVYRKPTFTSLITKWNSFVPKNYKYNALSTKVYRAIKICSSYAALHQEFEFIRSLALRNGYPNSVIDFIIRRQLNLVYTPATPIPAPSPTTDTVVLRVPYFGHLSKVYAKRIISISNKSYPLKHIRLVHDVQERVGSGFIFKDQIPDPMQAGVVYEATCPQCEVHYIGKTFRHFKTRVHEHLNYQKQDLCLKKIEKSKHTVKRPKSVIKTPAERKGPITRSQTKKLPIITIQTSSEDIGKLVKNPEILEKRTKQSIPKTAIAKHYNTTGHIFSNNDFVIRLKERYKYKLSIKESILIKQKKPELNKGIRSIPLYIYPDGIERNNKQNKTQRIATNSANHITNHD
ncbi:unnamed protein product [Rotaria sp. Silwood1]|nr:unnamed protein product [Rotaria sp. Silwood1]